MFVTERFVLAPVAQRGLRRRVPRFGFDGLGAVVFYRTYSRLRADGGQESWADVVIRVIEGMMSIRKDWYIKHRLPWDEAQWQYLAARMASALYDMKWTPPGRGLFACGSEHCYRLGASALQNCGAVSVTKLSKDINWMMSMLMHGVGVGADTDNYQDKLKLPAQETETFVVPDSREGWCESVCKLIESYEVGGPTIEFDYSLVRPAGAPIKTFGGTASGPDPLQKLHERLRPVLGAYAREEISATRVVADVVNLVGTAVVAGGVRRTAIILLGDPEDTEFGNLKNYAMYPERQEWGWASNNSYRLTDHEHFTRMGDYADRIRENGEPGLINLINLQKYGRLTEEMRDDATLVNPCGEQGLESHEVCCLADVHVNRCKTVEDFYQAVEFATIYASTITLLPTHSPETNVIVAKNRRIGVSISGVAEWIATEHTSRVIGALRRGYDTARQTNARMAKEAGVPISVRVTTEKPTGSTSQLTGSSPGLHYPPYTTYVRRMRAQKQSPIVPLLIEAGVPYEDDVYSDNTLVFEFPVSLGKVKGQRDVSMWQKGALAVMMQRHWSDNATSVTVTFDPKQEGSQVGDFLALTVPFLKSISMLPDTDEGAYAQMPYQAISVEEYAARKETIQPIDWKRFEGSDGDQTQDLYCDGDKCVI